MYLPTPPCEQDATEDQYSIGSLVKVKYVTIVEGEPTFFGMTRPGIEHRTPRP